jgi:hypothetical protein
MKLPFKEDFLHFVWQYQYFNHIGLLSKEGEKIEILNPGFKNPNAGPDFTNAKVKIGEIIWAGNIEIHLNEADWFRHQHQNNEAFDNVILHVVYESNIGLKAIRSDLSIIQTLVLKDLISKDLIEKGNIFFESMSAIPCSVFLDKIEPITLVSTLDRSLTERLQNKALIVLENLKKNEFDWEETTYQLIAQHFGMRVNSDTFLRLASITPLKLLQKSSNNIFAIEAMLYGQGGFLNSNLDDQYYISLKKEYGFLKHKFEITDHLNISEWKYLRLRPYNFPELRIAELAALYHKTPQIHALLVNNFDLKQLKDVFEVSLSNYWQSHYGFGKVSSSKLNGLGEMGIDNLLINVVVVLYFAYGIYKREEQYFEKAYSLLEAIKFEDNKITRLWSEFGVSSKNAFDSQALIELYNSSCSYKKCLNCQIGINILRK